MLKAGRVSLGLQGPEGTTVDAADNRGQVSVVFDSDPERVRVFNVWDLVLLASPSF